MFSPKMHWLLFATAAMALLPGTTLAQTNFDLVGYDSLEEYLGSGNVPTGDSVSLTIVEAPVASGTNLYYRINTGDSQLTGKTITFSPTFASLSSTTSWHATNTARYATGSSWSMTPGVSTIYQMPVVYNYVDPNFVLNLNDGFLGSDFLRITQDFVAPEVETRDIQNHSWVLSTGNSSLDAALILRSDFAVARDNYVAVVGVNNASSVAAGSPTADPNLNRNLLSSGFHVISAGRANGSHAWGDTTILLAGRQRPHIVVDADVTSWSTAITSSAAALLMDGASTMYAGDIPTIDAARDFRVVKSLIMAGAVKDGLGPLGDHEWAAVSSSKPLDEVYGAGRLNVLNSYQILEGGPQNASNVADADRTGWSLGDVNSGAPDRFFFNLTGAPEFDLSISLNWALNISPIGGNYNNMNATLTFLTLSIYEASGYSLLGGPIALSNSTIENLQYLWLPGLGAGRYAIQISSGSIVSTTYGLAWQAQAIPEPSAGFLGLLAIAFFLIRSRMNGRAAAAGKSF